MVEISKKFLEENIYKIFGTPSPTGYPNEINKVVLDILDKLGYEALETNKGNIELFISGLDHSKTIATSAHTDTLGLMVRSIKNNGMLSLTNLGGVLMPSLDGEYCQVKTRSGKVYGGTILCEARAVHVFPDARTRNRDLDNMFVRLDENVKNPSDVKKLGIDNGDYIFIDPKTVITESGFLKSRFIDDKGQVCALLSVLKYLKENNLKPQYDTYIYFVNHEEIGYGASSVSEKIDEFVTLDMGCIGLDLAGDEEKVSICAKDNAGPYNYDLTNKLIELAKENNIPYVIDIFPMYSSDVSAALKSGREIKGALIGPGVDASHGMERTTIKAIMETAKLIICYLTSK